MHFEKLKTRVAAAVVVGILCSAGAAAAAAGNRATSHVGAKTSQLSDATAHDEDDDDADDTTTTSSSTSSTSTSTTSTTQAPTSSTDADEADEADDATEKLTPVGPDVNGPAKKGLCNAYLGSLAKGHPKNPDAVAFKNLIDGAALAGQTVEEFCATDASPLVTTANAEKANGHGNGHNKP